MRKKRAKDQNERRERWERWEEVIHRACSSQTSTRTCGLRENGALSASCAPSQAFIIFEMSLKILTEELVESIEASNDDGSRKEREACLLANFDGSSLSIFCVIHLDRTCSF